MDSCQSLVTAHPCEGFTAPGILIERKAWFYPQFCQKHNLRKAILGSYTYYIEHMFFCQASLCRSERL